MAGYPLQLTLNETGEKERRNSREKQSMEKIRRKKGKLLIFLKMAVQKGNGFYKKETLRYNKQKNESIQGEK